MKNTVTGGKNISNQQLPNASGVDVCMCVEGAAGPIPDRMGNVIGFIPV